MKANVYRLNPKSPFNCVLLTTNKFNGLLYLTSLCAQWIDAFSVCQISASLLGQWPVLMSAINLWMQHYSIIPPTWARSRDLAWSGLTLGCIQENSIIITSTLAAAKICTDFYLLYSLEVFFLLWSHINPPGQVGPGAVWPEVSDEFYMRLLWTSEWSTEPGCRAVNVYLKMGTDFM